MGSPARAVAPPIDRLSGTLAEFERQIEADLAFRGIDLRDLWRPGGGESKLTYRRLGVLLDGLPGDSTYKTAVRDSIPDEQLAEMAKRPRDKHGTWSHTDLLIAALLDENRLLRRDLIAINGGDLAGEFEPTPRPGVPRGGPKSGRNPAVTAAIARIAEEHARLHGYDVTTGEPLRPDDGDTNPNRNNETG